jgi:hypothetical protein
MVTTFAVWIAVGNRLRLLDRQSKRMIVRKLAPGDALVDVGRDHRVGDDSDTRQEVEPAGACGSEDEPHRRQRPI